MTLVELVAVFAIMSILLGLSLPAVQMIRESSRQTACMNNERQIILALHHYESATGAFPPAIGRRLQHWQSQIIAFAGEQNLADEIDAGYELGPYPIFHPTGLKSVPLLQCVSNPDQGLLISSQIGNFAFSDYCGVAGIASNRGFGFFPSVNPERLYGTRPRDIIDGLSNTLCFGERPPSPAGFGFGRWVASQNSLSATIGVYEDYYFLLANIEDGMDGCLPANTGFQRGTQGSTCDWLHHWSFHPSGVNFAYADGSVRMISWSVSPHVLQALSTRADGEVVAELQ